MTPGWQNPITVAVGQLQVGIDPNALLPSRLDLSRLRLEAQRQLLLTGSPASHRFWLQLTG